MSVSVTGAYIYFTIPIFGGIDVTQTLVSSAIVTALLCISFVVLGKNLTKRPGGRQVLVEKGISMLYSMMIQSMGEHNASWFPFICTLFLSSICGSYIGLTGFLRSTTADLSTTLTWAIMVSVVIWYSSIKRNGFVGWLKGFTEPIVVMTPMNIVSEIAQPISLAFRHFGNVAGGGVITSIIYSALTLLSATVLNFISKSGAAISIVLLVLGAGLLIYSRRTKRTKLRIAGIITLALGFFGLLQALGVLSDVPILTFGIPAVLSLYFDLFSGFVQALVFTLLSMIFIGSACPPPEPEEAEQA